MNYDSKKMQKAAQFLVPKIRDNYKLIIVAATIQQFISIIGAFVLFYYTFNFSTYLIFPSIFLLLYFLHISINKSTVKAIKKEIGRQLKCKQLSKNK
jgi:hypothetical protein